jgi:3-oxoacyl-[acyl-carrier protein] reductase
MTYATAQQLGISFEEYERGYAERSPRRRIGEPEDVANAVDFFISEESDLITGQVLFVAGAP